MQHFYLLILSAMMIVGAPTLEAKPIKAKKESVSLTQRPSRQAVKRALIDQLTQRASASPTSARTVRKMVTAPSGTVKNYVESSTSFYSFWGYILDSDDTGIAGEIVFNEASGTAYLKNPISAFLADTYITGSYTGNTLSFTFPQSIYEVSGESLYVHRMVKDATSSSEYSPVYTIDDTTPVTFTIADDGSITMDTTGDSVILGLTYDDGEWTEYGDYNISFAPFDRTALTVADMPSDFEAALEKWAVIGSNASQSVRVAQYDGKLYLAGISSANTDALVVGTIDGNTVSFASDQYVGINPEDNHYQYFYGIGTSEATYDYDDDYYVRQRLARHASAADDDDDDISDWNWDDDDDWDWDDDDDNTYTAYNIEDAATFYYQPDEGILTCDNDAFGTVGGFVDDPTYITTYDVFLAATIKRVPENISLTPKAAYDLDYYAEYGEAFLDFYIDALTVDGWPLDASNISYRIYDDGKLFSFTPSVYVGVSSTMTELPYDFEAYDADYYYDIYADGAEHYVYFYSALTKPGVQVVYRDGDTEYASAIVYYGEDASVAEVVADREISAERYTDLSGRSVVNPAKGIYLKSVTYTDGSVKTVKVFVK